MTNLTHLHENGPSRAFANRNRCRKMPSQNHLCRYFGRFEASIFAYKRSAINNVRAQKLIPPPGGL